MFTRALDLVKLDPRSLDLWRACIKYLVGKDDVVGVLRAYKDALVVPQSYADTLLPEFEAFVASKPTTALVTPEQRAARGPACCYPVRRFISHACTRVRER